MPMQLDGSCHCGAVTFTVSSRHPYPFNLCYCSLCRKTAGAGGYAINLRADHDTLAVRGAEHVRVYRASIQNPEDDTPRQSEAQRSFCGTCGSALWLWDPRWPEMVHPHASAVDTPLPPPPERTHLMLEFAPPWVARPIGPQDRRCDRYPDESIDDWHRRLGLLR